MNVKFLIQNLMFPALIITVLSTVLWSVINISYWSGAVIYILVLVSKTIPKITKDRSNILCQGWISGKADRATALGAPLKELASAIEIKKEFYSKNNSSLRFFVASTHSSKSSPVLW